MAISTDQILNMLRAIGEETRLRIVLLLQHGELTVTDLTELLAQSQPRVSRHLKLLADAGVVDRHREGTRIYFELVRQGPIGELVATVAAATDPHDPAAAADLDRLTQVRLRRSSTAQEYFAGVAQQWDKVRSLHASDEDVEAAIIEVASDAPYHTLLDLGTGTGRMLQLLGGHATRAAGLDNSHSMLAVARANLERAEVRGVELRQGDVYQPPFDPHSFDLVVVHQVLHYLDDPGRAIGQAARLLSPGGRLLIVDFQPHALEFLRSEHAHRRLGLRHDAVIGWLEDARLTTGPTRTIKPPGDDEESLTVSLWVGTATSPATTPEPTTSPHTTSEIPR